MPMTFAEKVRLPDRALDRWLRFEPTIDSRWERDLGGDRVKDLRQAILVGLVLYNAFHISDFILLSDMIWQAVVSRIVLGTPLTLLLFWIMPRVSADWREWLIAIGVVNAALMVAPVFALSKAPWALFSFSGYFLFVVFANMLLALRFQQACAATLACFAVGVGSLVARDDQEDWIAIALTSQYATVCLFSLYANYLSERRRTKSYLTELAATLRSEFEEKARQRFQDLSLTDALTDLPNRRLLNSRLRQWSIERTHITVVMIDVDYFKLFNDALGHPAGDDCLRQIAVVLRSVVNEHIVAARFGGEEFTVVMRDVAELDAVRVVKDVLKAIEALGITHPGRRDGTAVVTASAGIASSVPGRDWIGDDIIAEADAALYAAKHGGRNQFSIAVR